MIIPERQVMNMNILEVQNLCKTYGKGEAEVRALDHISFSVGKGEFIAIVGESGSGKSTLLNVVGALDNPTSGKVLIDGKDIFSMPEKKLTVFRRQNIGFIFQSFNLIPELNVEQNITFPLLLDYQKPDQKYVEELLEILGLKERRKHLPSQLSGGQQQRVAIGRALAARPAIIMADEPTGNLDSKASDEIVALLKMSNRKYKQTIVMITHNLEIAKQADRVLTIEDGRIVNGEGELRNCNQKKQQHTVQAPGGFTDTSVAGNAPRSGGMGGELRNCNYEGR